MREEKRREDKRVKCVKWSEVKRIARSVYVSMSVYVETRFEIRVLSRIRKDGLEREASGDPRREWKSLRRMLGGE